LRQGKRYNASSFDRCRDPEGQVLIKKAPPEALVLIGIGRNPQINLARPWKLTSFLEETLSAVNLARCVDQKEHDHLSTILPPSSLAILNSVSVDYKVIHYRTGVLRLRSSRMSAPKLESPGAIAESCPA